MSSSPELEHAGIGAGIGALAPGRAIAVTGRDRASYLQGLLTNDIVALTAGTGCYAAWLTPQGRMLTDLHVLESGDMTLLDVPAAQHEATLARLEQFIFSEDVQVADIGASLGSLWIHGPEAAACFEGASLSLSGLADWRQYQHARGTLAGVAVALARIDQLGVEGFCLYAEHAQLPGVMAALEAAGGRRLAPELLETARVEAAYPLFGVDMTDDTIPLEAGIESRAISRTKGCYVGQEVIVRVIDRGHGRVARRLVSLAIAAGVPAPKAQIFSGDRTVGWITSAARSSRRGPIALGYVHRDLTAEGAQVEVELNGARVVAQVTGLAG